MAAAGREDVDPADALTDGRAMDVWRRMISAQGGDPDADLPWATETHEVRAPADGVLTQLDAYKVGVAAWRLGAGMPADREVALFESVGEQEELSQRAVAH